MGRLGPAFAAVNHWAVSNLSRHRTPTLGSRGTVPASPGWGRGGARARAEGGGTFLCWKGTL